MILRRTWLWVGVAVAAIACDSERRPDYFQPLVEAGAGTGGGGVIDAGLHDGPPPIDAGLCGNQYIPVVAEPPNLYFVIDRSGSMQEKEGAYTRYQHARIAMGKVLRVIGHRVSYGAAVFPSTGGAIEGCAAGKQVFPTQLGDPVSYAEQSLDGPVLKSLLTALAGIAPSGGTPIAATLTALTPTVAALAGDTVVVLATDGGPNCNEAASCSEDACMLNLEGASVGGVMCQPGFNCCDPTKIAGGQLHCLDGPGSLGAVSALAAQGVPTYVVGIPGSEIYADVLDQLAVAGGTARPGTPKYYAASDSAALSSVLKEIGAKVAISCAIELDFEPEDPKLVNVYFDKQVLPADDENGWRWSGPQSIEIVGPACDKLSSGDVLAVQVVGGCPTTVR